MDKVYFAYEICTNGAADMGVDTSAEAIWNRLVADLQIADNAGGIEQITLGKVSAPDVMAAISKVREGDWLPGCSVVCSGVDPEP